MPAELKSKKGSVSKATKRSSNADDTRKRHSKDAAGYQDNGDTALPEPLQYLGGKHRGAAQRSKYHEQFEELSAVIASTNASLRALATAEASARDSVTRLSSSATAAGSSSSSSTVATANAFPILSVGYLARAMGLNVSNEQVASIIDLIEEDGPSTGFVDKRKLEPVLVDALMTGTIGGPTLRAFAVAATESAGESAAGKLSVERLEELKPSLCVRDTEETLFRAFAALDVDQKGYLELEDLRNSMMSEGEPFSSAEVDEMWAAMQDPETNRVYYRDFADVLARE